MSETTDSNYRQV